MKNEKVIFLLFNIIYFQFLIINKCSKCLTFDSIHARTRIFASCEIICNYLGIFESAAVYDLTCLCAL